MNDGEGPPAEPAAEGEGRRGGHRARARTRQGDQRRPNRWRSRTKDQSERSHGGAVDDWAPTPRAKRRRGPPSEASRQRRGRRGGHRAEPPKERAVKATTAPNSFIWCNCRLYSASGATPPDQGRGGGAPHGKDPPSGAGGVERRSAARASNAGQASNARNGATERANPAPPAGPRTTVRLQAPRYRSLYIRRRSS